MPSSDIKRIDESVGIYGKKRYNNQGSDLFLTESCQTISAKAPHPPRGSRFCSFRYFNNYKVKP